MSRLSVVSVFFLIIVLGGCSQLKQSFVSPEATVAGFRLTEIGLFSGKAEIELEVSNPNAYRLVADGLRYQVWLGGFSIADTRSDRRIELPANDRTRIEIPLEFSYQGLYSAVQSMMQTGVIGYRVEGAISTHFIELPFSQSGQFEVPKEEYSRSSPSVSF